MKKVVIFLFVFFYLLYPVKAEVYYSEYGNYSDWSLERRNKSDVLDEEVDRRYIYYHENIIGDYYIEDENPIEYNYVDKSMWKTETIEWVSEKPASRKNQTIEERTVYFYKYVRPIRYIVISNIRGSNNKLDIVEIEAVARNNNLDYQIICNACSNNFDNYVKNGIVSEDNSYILNNNSLIIDLNIYLNIDELTLFIYFHDSGLEDVNFDMSYKYELDGNSYYTVNYIDRVATTITTPKVLEYNYYDLVLDNPSWSDELYTLKEIDGNNFMNVRKETQYKVTNIYYFYYKIFKDHSQVHNDYYNMKDENLYEDYYRYRTRDKVEIEDNIVIDNNQRLEDFIISSSVEVNIESNIDYSKNGKYIVKYITPFRVIEREVVVNSEYNDMLDKINTLSKEIEDSNIQKNNYINEINNYILKIEELNKEIEKYKNSNDIDNYNKYIEELNNYNIKIEQLNSELINYENEIKNKEKENNRIKREYENEIINLKISDNNKIEVEEKEVKKISFIPLILLWLLVIITLIIIVLCAKKEKTKTSFVENV